MKTYSIRIGNLYVKVDEIYSVFYGDDYLGNERIQIRGIVDKEWIVVKNQNNNYKLLHRSWFDKNNKNLKLEINWG